MTTIIHQRLLYYENRGNFGGCGEEEAAKMIKLCPSCRLKNAGDAGICSGCGRSLEDVPPKEGGGGITMFGGLPPQVGIAPLDKAAPTVSRAYGEARAQIAVGSDDGREDAEERGGSSSSPSAAFGARPKKPWE